MTRTTIAKRKRPQARRLRAPHFAPARTPSAAFAPLLLLILLIIIAAHPTNARAEAWPTEREWTEKEELSYSKWFEKLASKQWTSTDRMLHDAEYNTLYDDSDKEIHFYSDCGDFPYIIRAYYAYKRRLPFVANTVTGGRYTPGGNTTASTYDNKSHTGSVQSFFNRLIMTHSGAFRTSPDATDSFTYPIAIHRASLRPGAVFYSPAGHAALVSEVRKDGTIKLADAHPDQTVTRTTFGPKLEVRTATFAGGFRTFRKTITRDGKSIWIRDNAALPHFSKEQFEFDEYYSSVKEKLTETTIIPLTAFERYIREDTYQEVLDRVESVDKGWVVARDRFIARGSNIYDATGDWENYSTPSRDLRLRLSMLNIPVQVEYYMNLMRQNSHLIETPHATPEELGRALLELKKKTFRELTFDYTNSAGKKVRLSLNDVEKRLFRLSFDPNHAPELRWGATGKEYAPAKKLARRHTVGYKAQQSWRNRLTKKQGPMRPHDPDNPRVSPPHDITRLIVDAIKKPHDGHGVQTLIASGDEPAPRTEIAPTTAPPSPDTPDKTIPEPDGLLTAADASAIPEDNPPVKTPNRGRAYQKLRHSLE